MPVKIYFHSIKNQNMQEEKKGCGLFIFLVILTFVLGAAGMQDKPGGGFFMFLLVAGIIALFIHLFVTKIRN